jgi:pimeloyl-ACP methyl ester carboxylesterase
MWAGGPDCPGGVREAAEAAGAAPPSPEPPRVVDVVLDVFAMRSSPGMPWPLGRFGSPRHGRARALAVRSVSRPAAEPRRRKRGYGSSAAAGWSAERLGGNPDLKAYRTADPRQIVTGALTDIEGYALPDSVREDYLSSYQGNRFVESMRYVRSYPTDLPVLRDLLPQIQTPVQIIAGRRDPAVPPGNGEFLHQRRSHSKLDVIDAGHFTWEDAADEYAALVTSWWSGGYATTRSAAAR